LETYFLLDVQIGIGEIHKLDIDIFL